MENYKCPGCKFRHDKPFLNGNCISGHWMFHLKDTHGLSYEEQVKMLYDRI